MREFVDEDLRKIVMARGEGKGDNGQVTVIGGSKLFHGAPIMALAAASRVADMVYFASPEPTLGAVVAQIKAKLGSFIWVAWEEVGDYIEKSDAVLIGPGFKRRLKERSADHGSEVFQFTKSVTERLVSQFPNKKWVIDGGSLQTMDSRYIPVGAVLTPNRKELGGLFGDVGDSKYDEVIVETAKKFKCVIAGKGPKKMVVSDGEETLWVRGAGIPLTQGGTGDVLAGLTVGMLAKNQPLAATAAAGYLVQRAVESLSAQVGVMFNSDDLAWEVGKVWRRAVSPL